MNGKQRKLSLASWSVKDRQGIVLSNSQYPEIKIHYAAGDDQKNTGPVELAPCLMFVVDEDDEPEGREGGLVWGLL